MKPKNPLEADPVSRRGLNLIPGNPGNSGGKKGRSGRPSSALRDFMRACLESPDHQEAVRAVLANPKSMHFATMTKLALAYAEGVPTQRIEHTGDEGGPIEILTEARDAFHSRMARLTARLGAAAMPEGLD